jgi:hypothetical protein
MCSASVAAGQSLLHNSSRQTLPQIPYFTDYKTHFFLQKIASKIQVRLILEINTKMSSV